MIETELTADQLALRLLEISKHERVCISDTCGTVTAGPNLLIAGVGPVSARSIRAATGDDALAEMEKLISITPAGFFTISYDLGLKILGLYGDRHGERPEPDIFFSGFESLIVHDYGSGKTFIDGANEEAAELAHRLENTIPYAPSTASNSELRVIESDTSKSDYLRKVEEIREFIRSGDTYQANLTQKFTAKTEGDQAAQDAFAALRANHPSAFAAFVDRGDDQVVSISPERFLKIDGIQRDEDIDEASKPARIRVAPIKGTRPRSAVPLRDRQLRNELTSSAKDRAENIMITDLLRNDLGRVCEYGSVSVSSLCEIKELPTLFHLESRVEGNLRTGTRFSDVVRALFPCGSITGAPKISTMKIIDQLEPSARGLSMGSIGYMFDGENFPRLRSIWTKSGDYEAGIRRRFFDLSVAIRTMVFRAGSVEFNTGGGIVIDSDAEEEYGESLAKAEALFRALGGSFEQR